MCNKSKVKSKAWVSEEQVEEVNKGAKRSDAGREGPKSKMRIFYLSSL